MKLFWRVLGGFALAVAWQIGSAAALTPSTSYVIDSTGKTVGILLNENAVLMSLGGVLAYAHISDAGFAQESGVVYTLFFRSSDCSGPTLIIAKDFPPLAFKAANNYLFYPIETPRSILTHSHRTPGSGACTSIDQDLYRAATARPYSLTTLGITPPFTIRVVQ